MASPDWAAACWMTRRSPWASKSRCPWCKTAPNGCWTWWVTWNKTVGSSIFFGQLPNGKIPKTEGVLICFNGTIIYRWWIFHCHICFFRRVLVLCCVFFVVPLFSQSSKATLWMRSSPLILFIFCWCYCFEKTMIWCSLLLNGTGS